jgi:LacI family transcriptional regulator
MPESRRAAAGRAEDRRKATIRDVAAAAGVSVTTVSPVLNEVDGARIAEETRARVREAAQALSYVPSRLARGLRTQRTNIIGLLSDHIATTPHAGKIILGAQEEALSRGWILLIFNTGGDRGVERREAAAMLAHEVEGVLYASMYHRVVTLPSVLASVPTVLLDARTADPSVPAVVPDEVAGGRTAVAELLRQGHRRIGFVTNRDDIPATHGRLRGYQEALRSAGCAFDAGLVAVAESESGGGYLAARALLTRPKRPTALFCFNDRMAMGAYRAAAEMGLAIPADLSVVGFDNQEIIADGLYPGLTTVALPHYEMGQWAVRALTRLIESRPGGRERASPHLMACPLVRRRSVGPPPGP